MSIKVDLRNWLLQLLPELETCDAERPMTYGPEKRLRRKAEQNIQARAMQLRDMPYCNNTPRLLPPFQELMERLEVVHCGGPEARPAANRAIDIVRGLLENYELNKPWPERAREISCWLQHLADAEARQIHGSVVTPYLKLRQEAAVKTETIRGMIPAELLNRAVVGELISLTCNSPLDVVEKKFPLVQMSRHWLNLADGKWPPKERSKGWRQSENAGRKQLANARRDLVRCFVRSDAGGKWMGTLTELRTAIKAKYAFDIDETTLHNYLKGTNLKLKADPDATARPFRNAGETVRRRKSETEPVSHAAEPSTEVEFEEFEQFEQREGLDEK